VQLGCNLSKLLKKFEALDIQVQLKKIYIYESDDNGCSQYLLQVWPAPLNLFLIADCGYAVDWSGQGELGVLDLEI
jgi:hypothetical protein